MLLYLLLVLSAAVILYFKWCFGHWKRLGFPYVEAKTPFGVIDPVIRTLQKSMGMAIYDVYKQTKGKIVGIYLITRPALMVRDAQLARDMLTKDFSSFHDRGVYIDEIHDPMSAALFSLKGQKWKSLRAKLAPSFTSGKLKSMFGTIQDVSCRLVDYLEKSLPENGQPKIMELKHLFVVYSIDIVASAIFGLDVDSFKNPNNPIFAMSKNVNEKSFRGVLRSTCQFLFPSWEKMFQRLGWTEPAPENMKKLVRQTIEHREKQNIVRKDLLQLLLQLRNTGKINGDEDDEWSAQQTKDALKSISIELIAAQLFLFYVAGFETSASTAAFTLYELMKYRELLEKAQEDVRQALEKHQGSLSYDCLSDMKFLDMCIMETLRKYPGLPFLNRECTHDYPIPDTNLIIRKGTPIIIPVLGIQRDEEYFPQPLCYDPDRFLPDKSNYMTTAYMPFGEGPRHCIAQRMGKLIVKTALAQVLSKFHIEPNPHSPEIEIDNFGIPIMAKGGVLVKFARKTKSVAI